MACKAPPDSGSEYYNYKGFFSIILFAIVSSDYMFLWVDMSGNGSSSDTHIYNNSELREGLEHNNIMGWPQPEPLPHDSQDVPYFLVGDDAFSLKTYLMKPYSARNLDREQRIFNYRLSWARRVVENAFGILTNRFQVLLSTMNHHAANVRLIVKAPPQNHADSAPCAPELPGRCASSGWQHSAWCLSRGEKSVLCRHPTEHGKRQRNLLRHWCNSPAGTVTWTSLNSCPSFN